MAQLVGQNFWNSQRVGKSAKQQKLLEALDAIDLSKTIHQTERFNVEQREFPTPKRMKY